MVDFHALTERLERIYTPRLALRQASLADGWPLFAASRNPLFNKHLLWEQPMDEWPMLDRIDAIVETARRGKLSAVSAVERETGVWISLFRFLPYGLEPRTVEMGVWTHHAFWHGTYTFELVGACIDAVFSFTEIDRLIAAAMPAHERSRRLLGRLGLTRHGSIVHRPDYNGGVVDVFEHRITRQEWMQQAERRRFGVVEPATLRAAAAAPIKVGAGISPRGGNAAPAHRPSAEGIVVEPLTLEVDAGRKAAAQPPQMRPQPSAQVSADGQGD